MEENKPIIPDEVVMTKIYEIRNQKVMLDRDLAELYGVETKRLKEQVRRNKDRFPDDFMFEMTKDELKDWRSQFAMSNSEVMGMRRPPFVFTEHGVLMLSSVLNSKRAIQVNIQIVRIFSKMREILLTHKDLLLKMEQMEYLQERQGEDIDVIFKYLEKLLKKDKEKENQEKRKRIGYKRD
jgi:phage regulator Rha-like protein